MIYIKEKFMKKAENKNVKKLYGPISSIRTVSIKVYINDKLEYDGMVEDAPANIKKMKYYDIKIEIGGITNLYVDKDNN